MTSIITALTSFITHVISSAGYPGVAFLMAIESAAIPLPSEVIMPFAGYVVSQGQLTLLGITLAGGIGSVIGSAITYWIGRYGGRPLVERYGKYILITHHDLDLADRFFKKYDSWASFIGRLIPVVRTFISIPAGIAEAPFGKFILYSFLGSIIWSAFLGYLGLQLGPQWVGLRDRFHSLDYLIIALILIAAAWWIYRHWKHRVK